MILLLSNSYSSFIAGFAFVLQRHRAKPIPLKMYERVHRLPPGGSFYATTIITQIGRENKFSAEIYVPAYFSAKNAERTVLFYI